MSTAQELATRAVALIEAEAARVEARHHVTLDAGEAELTPAWRDAAGLIRRALVPLTKVRVLFEDPTLYEDAPPAADLYVYAADWKGSPGVSVCVPRGDGWYDGVRANLPGWVGALMRRADECDPSVVVDCVPPADELVDGPEAF